MHFPFSKLIYLSAITISVGAFVTGGEMLFDSFIDKQNRRQMQELGNRTLERAERAVDYAVISLAELAEQGATSCAEDDLEAIRRQVYSRGTIKDIRIVGAKGRVLCSAHPETLAFDVDEFSEAEKLKGRNGRVALFRLDQRSGRSLGLAWELSESASLVAVVNTDGLLFDMLPAGLRDDARAYLELGNSSVIAHYAPGEDGHYSLASPVAFSTASQRYPLKASIHVNPSALASWNKDSKPAAAILSGLLGLAFGVLLGKVLHRRSDPVADLDRALAAGEIVPYMQPIFSLGGGEIVGCEVLSRWQRSDGSVGSPYHFIPLAEQSGRIARLTRQIVAKALLDLGPLLRANKTFKVCFNIAPQHFLSDGFVNELRQLAWEATVGTRQIVVELTERQELPDLASAAAVIAKLRDHGFRVAMDDTGTGHSGLSYIHKLGVNEIKIDKLFVDSVGEDHTAKAVVEMLVRLARELNMTTIAEGIETKEQIKLLKDYGVDEGQGYVVSPPLPAAEFLSLVAARDRKDASRRLRLASSQVA